MPCNTEKHDLGSGIRDYVTWRKDEKHGASQENFENEAWSPSRDETVSCIIIRIEIAA